MKKNILLIIITILVTLGIYAYLSQRQTFNTSYLPGGITSNEKATFGGSGE